jgi:hypothetical protein
MLVRITAQISRLVRLSTAGHSTESHLRLNITYVAALLPLTLHQCTIGSRKPCVIVSTDIILMELELFLRPTVSRPVRLGIGPPFGTLDQIISCSSFFVWQLRYSAFKAPSLTRERVCSLQCNHSLVRAVTPNNHTLPSHLRLCSLTARRDCDGSILTRPHTGKYAYVYLNTVTGAIAFKIDCVYALEDGL